MNVRRALLTLVVVGLSAWASAEEIERIWLDGEVNGKPVRFAFDTGAGASLLMRRTALKLELQLTPPQTNLFTLNVPTGKQDLELTEECRLHVGPIDGPSTFVVLDSPTWTKADFEGVLGWFTVTNAIVCIDAFVDGVTFLDKVPPLATEWSHIRAVPIQSGLGLEIPHGNHPIGILAVDTGSDRGIALPPQTWRKWKKAHPRAALTLGTSYTPSDGFYVYEETWADRISFGTITFNNVPIAESGPSGVDQLGAQYEGTIGLAALKRLELVVDSSHAVAYWKSRKSTQAHYSYNRLAAVFRPNSKHPNEAVARVVKGGPAYAAGVRDGDVLLQVDGIKVTSWNDGWLSRFALPAGTSLKLALTRSGKSFQTTATLREILKPDLSSN